MYYGTLNRIIRAGFGGMYAKLLLATMFLAAPTMTAGGFIRLLGHLSPRNFQIMLFLGITVIGIALALYATLMAAKIADDLLVGTWMMEYSVNMGLGTTACYNKPYGKTITPSISWEQTSASWGGTDWEKQTQTTSIPNTTPDGLIEPEQT